jgi:hypothetical protein|tara:strand:+ start:597 stop:794 length:198 start_codon:yes stop_codon:yes gene_type:complete
MTNRFTHLFRTRNKEKKILDRAKSILFNRKEVNINGNGTSGYVVKEGINKDKILAHNNKKSTNNW